MKNKIWFRRKRYGWGWYPCTWQGWLIIAVWIMLFTLLVTNPSATILIPISLLVFILIKICYLRGEKPRWSWGD